VDAHGNSFASVGVENSWDTRHNVLTWTDLNRRGESDNHISSEEDILRLRSRTHYRRLVARHETAVDDAVKTHRNR